jgi:hypothetical protein
VHFCLLQTQSMHMLVIMLVYNSNSMFVVQNIVFYFNGIQHSINLYIIKFGSNYLVIDHDNWSSNFLFMIHSFYSASSYGRSNIYVGLICIRKNVTCDIFTCPVTFSRALWRFHEYYLIEFLEKILNIK